MTNKVYDEITYPFITGIDRADDALKPYKPMWYQLF